MDYETRTNRLRLEIAVQRRQIDRQVRATQRQGQQLLSWRTYARRYPVWMLAAGLGAGLAAAAGLGRRGLSR